MKNTPSSAGQAFSKVKNQMESYMQNPTGNFEKTSKEFMTRMEEAASLNRSHMEACVQAGTIMAEGMKDMSQAVFNNMQTAVQSSVEAGRAMMGVKTLRELMSLQTEYMKSLFDTMMSDSTRISEIAVRCTSEAAEPISASVTSVVEKIADRAKSAA
jgi:phasin family protein